LNVVWDKENERLITATSLERAANMLEWDGNGSYLDHLKSQIVGKIPIEEPVGYGGRNRLWGWIDIDKVNEIDGSSYTPAVPILTEPGLFMTLIPANNAMNVVNAIKDKYQREMAKVANRMPLQLGVVFAPQHTPLRAILDAGRRMLTGGLPSYGWHIDRPVEHLPGFLAEDPHYKDCLNVPLSRYGRTLNWAVPLMMGDGVTRDAWYPYAAVEQPNTDYPANERERGFQVPHPNKEGEAVWNVHVQDLQPGDQITFTPSTFDFEWLDSAARRFEIGYITGSGERSGQPRRPYLFSELDAVEQIWEVLRDNLSKSQIYALRDLIEDRRSDWDITQENSEPGGIFWQFCWNALKNLQWPSKPDIQWDLWADYAVKGWITDAVELHLHILKDKVKTQLQEAAHE
jgi:hypothetical protein